MRLVILGLSLALAGSAPLGFAAAQGPVTTQPLAAGEVLLEINALGSVTSRADHANLSVSISGEGDTEAAARTATETKIREVRAALRTLGVADADIRIRPVTTSANPSVESEVGALNAMATAEDTNMVMPMEDAPTPAAASGRAALEIVVRNIDNVAPVLEALAARGAYSTPPGPAYALTDASGARRQARAQALQTARADAEAYAAPLNMRVARIVRITERIGLDMFSLVASEPEAIMQMFTPSGLRGPIVKTMVVVGVDFALVPR